MTEEDIIPIDLYDGRRTEVTLSEQPNGSWCLWVYHEQSQCIVRIYRIPWENIKIRTL